MEGFIGSACQYLDCVSKCNNGGRCLDMHDRAARMRYVCVVLQCYHQYFSIAPSFFPNLYVSYCLSCLPLSLSLSLSLSHSLSIYVSLSHTHTLSHSIYLFLSLSLFLLLSIICLSRSGISNLRASITSMCGMQRKSKVVFVMAAEISMTAQDLCVQMVTIH